MHRLFVAITPPGTIRAQLLQAMGGISGARWQNDDQLHITLRFIGEVDGPTAEDAAAALAGVNHPGFAIALSGLGLFDSDPRRTALWIGVSPHDAITSLHKKVDQALVRIGLAPEKRAYLPHLTLARLGRNAGAIGGFIESQGGLATPPFTVTHFGLYESALTREGAAYTLVERYRLSAWP